MPSTQQVRDIHPRHVLHQTATQQKEIEKEERGQMLMID